MTSACLFAQAGADSTESVGVWQRMLGALEGAGAAISAVYHRTMTAFGNHDFRILIAVVLGAAGLALLMPGRRRASRVLGVICFIAAGGFIVSVLPNPGMHLATFLFWLMAGVTVFAAVGTVTSQSPVYCAIWFALTLLGVGGLMLVGGAQFLGVATVAVYAGAIVVTFLFVLMLAQPEGHAYYDRVSWGTVACFLGCLAGMAMMGAIVWASQDAQSLTAAPADSNPTLVADHVANLGGQLFTSHLVAAEVAGVLLLAALVGAVVIAAFGAHGRARLQRQLDSAIGAGGGEMMEDQDV